MKNFEEWLLDNAKADDLDQLEGGLNDALWTNNVIKYQKEYDSYKSLQPPKLRPMSELPEGKCDVTVLFSTSNGNEWGEAYCVDGKVTLYDGGVFYQETGYTSKWSGKLIGWIPSRELPNPNDIEL